MKLFKVVLIFTWLCLLYGCASFLPDDRRQNTDKVAGEHGWHQLILQAGKFDLIAYVPKQVKPSHLISIYIEGDGLAWLTPSQPSLDPTPIHPLGLELAMSQARGLAVYLARPCQFTGIETNRNCAVTYWTDRRFSPDVIQAIDAAIGQLKQRFNADQLELIGYSGGGAIATLVAARRNDVVRLVTVAGNLDIDAWTSLHHSSALRHSLNPADAWEKLLHTKQIHLVGSADKNMSSMIAESYRMRFPEQYRPAIDIIQDFDHHCCWVEQWSVIYSKFPSLLEDDVLR